MNNGAFIISLDFELLWGVFDVVDHEAKREYFSNTRKLIPELLRHFTENDIHATWATVGMLFSSDWEEWENDFPPELPGYKNEQLSAYEFGKRIRSDSTMDLCFAPELVEVIRDSEGQEVATHTYSHYYCLEEGQDEESFKQDLEMAVEKAKEIGVDLKSLVFPRNQRKESYLKICANLGIKNVRSNPSSWYWKDATSENLMTKLGRTGDAYLPFGKKSYSFRELQRKEGLPLEQKASRFLRPVENNALLRQLKLKRILSEMETAAKKKEIYHLWWHPHNFGDRPEESMKDLKILIDHFLRLRKSYGFTSLNMAELGSMVS